MKKRLGFKKPLFWLVIVLLLSVTGSAAAQDHFQGRRGDAQRPNSFWEGRGGVELRPWGGPTTGRNWWTPVPRQPGNQPAVRMVYVPGHFEWYYGQRIWVPGRYVVVPIYTFGNNIDQRMSH